RSPFRIQSGQHDCHTVYRSLPGLVGLFSWWIRWFLFLLRLQSRNRSINLCIRTSDDNHSSVPPFFLLLFSSSYMMIGQ
ncbi:unnamed protein product, partial [Musa hybrid cultivar]